MIETYAGMVVWILFGLEVRLWQLDLLVHGLRQKQPKAMIAYRVMEREDILV